MINLWKKTAKLSKRKIKSMSGYSNLDRLYVREHYINGESTEEISHFIGCSARTIQRYLAEIGLIRSKRDSFILAIEKGRMTYDHLMVSEKTRNRRKSISPKTRYKILSRDGFKCVLCGATTDSNNEVKLQVDHIKQLIDGGSNSIDNLQTLCSECNQGKYLAKNINNGKTKLYQIDY